MTKHILNLREQAQELNLRVYADAGAAQKVLNELNATFQAFRDENDKRLADIEKGQEDVVTNEKVDRINNAVGEQQALLNKLAEEIDRLNIAAARAGMGGGSEVSPEIAAHIAAFHTFFRTGVDAGLSDLEVQAALSTQSDPDGGYVVPVEFDTEIDRVLGNMGAMRSLARVQPISAGTYKKLVNKGGAGGGWVGEEDSRPETDPAQLAELAFNAMEMYAEPRATQTLLEDAYLNIVNWLAEEVSETFLDLESEAFITGNGQKRPRGLLTYDTITNASWTWGKLGYNPSGTAATLGSKPIDTLINAQQSLKRAFRNNAMWLMNSTTEGTIRKVKTTTDDYIWQPSIQVGTPAMLLGKGVEIDDFMPDIAANVLPIAYGDFRRGYLIIDRRGTQVLRDPYTSKPYVKFYTTRRVGGGVQNYQAIKLVKCATS